MKSDIVLFGTGSLARSVTYNLATTVAANPLRVLIVGRSRDDLEEVASVAQGRAGAMGQLHMFDTLTANWADGSSGEYILDTHRPTVTVVAASEQSPWELADDANAWARLVKRGGFGVTLPFNANLASQVFRAANATIPRPFFINACLSRRGEWSVGGARSERPPHWHRERRHYREPLSRRVGVPEDCSRGGPPSAPWGVI